MPGSVAIVICTRDRAESLRATLCALGGCVVPTDLAVELVVVDNASTDQTAAVVRETPLPNLPVRRVLESQPGLSRARNAGVRATQADVMLFTDDDVRPPEGWIEAMCRPLLNDRADAVAGGVHFPPSHEALFAREPFRSKRGWFASTHDHDPAAPTLLVGANMAFTRRALETVGEFDQEIGAGALGFHEETLYSARLLAAGFRLAGAGPAASVEHHFDLSRLTRHTLLNIAERMGRSSAWITYHWDQEDTRVPAVRLWRTRLLLRIFRALTPWRVWRKAAPSWELWRVHTLAYLEQLGRFTGQPRKYSRPTRAA